LSLSRKARWLPAGALVLWVLGNHEFYGGAIEELHGTARAQCQGTSITPMIQDKVVMAGVRFLGCTMWTDYELGGNAADTQLAKISCGQMLADHKLIRGIEKPEHAFSVQDALNLHKQDRAWLAGQLSIPFEGKTVVITHHGPHIKSVHHKYIGNALNGGFVSDLSSLMPSADVWIHGHVHPSTSSGRTGVVEFIKAPLRVRRKVIHRRLHPRARQLDTR
jgi:hypothetical protein